MTDFRLVKSEVKPLTLDVATAFRDLEPSPTERDLNPSRLKMLRDKAAAGLLITFHWAKARMGGKYLRVNGITPSTMSETGAGVYGTFYPGPTSKLDYELYIQPPLAEVILTALRALTRKPAQKTLASENAKAPPTDSTSTMVKRSPAVWPLARSSA